MWWVVSLLLFLPYLIHWFPLFRRVCGWSSDPYHGTMLASTVSQVCQLSSWSSWHWVCQEPGKVRTWLVSFLALLVIACFILHFDSSCYCVIFRPLCKQCNSEFRTGTKKFCAKCRYSEAAVLDNVCNVHPLLPFLPCHLWLCLSSCSPSLLVYQYRVKLSPTSFRWSTHITSTATIASESEHTQNTETF